MDKESWEWDELDYFRLVDDLSINEAAALIAGASPNDVYLDDYDGSSTWRIRDDIPNKKFSAVATGLVRSVERGDIPAILVTGAKPRFWKSDSSADWQPIGEIDQSRTTIHRDDIREWLKKRGFTHGFFFPSSANAEAPYLVHGDHYAPKLAACVMAWQAAHNDPSAHKNPKSYMVDWLSKNAAGLGVTALSESSLDELAAVSNWEKSPGRKEKTSPHKTESSPHISDHQSSEQQGANKKRSIVSGLSVVIPEATPVDFDDDLPF